MTVSECLKSIDMRMPDVPEVIERVTTKKPRNGEAGSEGFGP